MKSTSQQSSSSQSKRKIWDVSGTISSQPNQSTTGSSQTRGRVFTATTNGIKPFWNSSTKEGSEKLLSCTATDLRELDKSSWTGSLKSLASGSWFTVKVKTKKKENRMNSCQSSPSSLLQAIMEKEQQRTNVDALKKQKQQTKVKEKELKRIQDHNDRVTKGWTQEDITKRNSLEQSLERLEVEKTQKIRSAKKIANERARTKNDLEKLFKRYDMITPNSSMKKEKLNLFYVQGA